MTPTILAALTVWVVQIFLPAGIRYALSPLPFSDRLRIAAGGRDVQPALGVYGERAQRALNNYAESMPVFLGLALLLELRGGPSDLARTGALVFVIGRALYVPAYLSAVPGLRSLFWTLACGGLGAMAWALLG